MFRNAQRESEGTAGDETAGRGGSRQDPFHTPFGPRCNPVSKASRSQRHVRRAQKAMVQQPPSHFFCRGAQKATLSEVVARVR